ncbi:Crp/Fnr family transcriptional regulator [Agrobacterium larrymoorei]|uniref:Crp/Fnr family transcriptional regulator n=1 Tax=Agrobacterium larrymoorei TaxID=160699 RepID=UPI001574724B|nr:Crp/Fnr family transcriptional regulator [Agrobacterium larrymoorei]NTJ43928.1 Crp/Fnr family transcriptional regulator [Agrobacterium larrymoorei]
MHGKLNSPPANNLLRMLSGSDFALIAPHLEYVVLPKGTVLANRDQPIDAVYFLTSGIGSVVITTPQGRRAEAGIFGFDGYIPTSAITGSRISSHDVAVQLDAEGYQISFDAFRTLLDQSKPFSVIMNRSMECFSVQLAHTAVSNALHDISVRLARWLLMCQDRSRTEEMAMTHELMAVLLGVRRPSVTTALHVLEGEGLIRSLRGKVVVRDRAALINFARDAYGRPEAEYQRIMSGQI